MIEYIIFDLSEVLITGYYGTEKRISKLLDIDEKEVDLILKGENFFNLMLGEITEEQYINDILKKTNWDISINKFKSVIRENHNQAIKGTLEIVKELSKKYKLVLLSDHVKEWIEDILRANANQVIFIDDSKRNVEVATSLGIESIIFENAVQLRRELENRKVII